MRSDTQIYKIFRIHPEYFFELVGIQTNSPYKMTSETVKEISRTMDCLLTPLNHLGIHYVVEFQNQDSDTAYARMFVETSQLIADHPENLYNGIVIFKNRQTETRVEPLATVCRLEGSGFRVFYLEELIENLRQNNPDHPLVALFFPFLEKEDERFTQKARQYYDQIQNSSLKDTTIEELIAVFFSWVLIRLKKKNIDEVKQMLGLDTPLEETVGYKQLVAIEEKRGEKREKRGKILGEMNAYEKLHQSGKISDELYHQEISALKKELEALQEASDS